MCSCGPSVCYKYEDCGPALQCLPRSAFKRNGLQDCQFFQQGSIRYLCRAGPCCTRPCPSRCPPCVRRPPPGKTYKEKGHEDQASHHAKEGSAQKNEKENQLKRTKSRELRGGIMYYSCHCIKRNGLQHDCRRTGCGGEPACLVLPDPVCPPSQLARARGLAAPLVVPNTAASGGTSGGHTATHSHNSGKRFIVCELKEVHPDAHTLSKSEEGKCCKCAISQDRTVHSNPDASSGVCFSANIQIPTNGPRYTADARCPCKSVNTAHPHSKAHYSLFPFDEETLNTIRKSLESGELAVSSQKDKPVIGPGGRARKPKPPVVKETCTRPGCMHWQPPPPCVWDLPCKADCFETPAGIQPGRNKLKSGSGGWVSREGGSLHGV